MSRPRPRGVPIGGRLAEVLQDDLADIASTIDWIDAAPVVDEPPERRASPVVVEPGIDPAFDLMLDDFALAVDAMFSARDEALASDPAAMGDPGDDVVPG